MPPLEYILIGFSGLLLLSVFISKASEKFGIPGLLLFLAIGMLAGSEGIGGIHFDDAKMAQLIGVIALCVILFAGGLDTDWQSVKPVIGQGLVLSTLGVFSTASVVACFGHYVMGLSWLEGFLLGSIMASTDAAAVFSVLRSKNVSLKGRLRPLLEFESGSNDPMAVFMTIGFLGLLTEPTSTLGQLVGLFFLQMIVGTIIGYAMGRAIVFLVNRLRLEYEGLYPVMTISMVFLAYALATVCKGNGFLAVYVAALTMGSVDFVFKKQILQFHDGTAWLMQIVMFLGLGLLVFPKQLVPVAGDGFLVSAVLIFIARPVSVMISLFWAKMSWRELVMISWVGLRGSVPIVLATFPLLAGIEKDNYIFNIVFFVVLTSVLLQGTSIPLVAKLLGVDEPLERKRRYPLEFASTEGADMQMVDFIIPYEGRAVGKQLVELGLPKNSLVTLICRDDKCMLPRGDAVLEGGDVLLTLVNDESLPVVRKKLTDLKR